MKSKSDRLPKFRELEPAPGPIVKTDPLLWVPKKHGLPCWYRPFDKHTVIQPFFTPRAVAEAAIAGVAIDMALAPYDCEIVELRARANPWHPSGRLERLTLRLEGLTFVLKFHGEGEPIQCISVFKESAAPVAAAPIEYKGKYKGPRQGDGITVNARKRR